jgi:hypothetical protein
MRSDPPVNGGRELSGRAVVVAHRNAQSMSKQGYQWVACQTCSVPVGGVPRPQVGEVHTPKGDTYTVWLPGALALYPEGKCDCPFFVQNAICKHLYFAVEEARKASCPATIAAWEPGF